MSTCGAGESPDPYSRTLVVGRASRTTPITGTDHLARGYSDLPSRLRALGAHVTERP
ncbi:hypothetical protein [Streptomyces puniciscabiei]|uniref:hypothetical protein n=1 Tax=Streptomyces puniciscabiei TaxID=164348 RepID=UPI003789D781